MIPSLEKKDDISISSDHGCCEADDSSAHFPNDASNSLLVSISISKLKIMKK